MKIIFLDMDGVLNSHQSDLYYSQFYPEKVHREDRLCPLAISNLMQLMKSHPDTKIVISSSWRKGRSVEDFNSMLDLYGLPPDLVISKTPHLNTSQTRGHQIKQWLTENKNLPISHFVILDDDADMDEYLNTTHFIQTDGRIGFSYLELEKVLQYFGNYVLTFNDLKIGETYKLFSKPQDTIYTFDGSGFYYVDDQGVARTGVMFYPQKERFCKA